MSDLKNRNGKGRTRNFATVIYPDSAPGNWQEVLADLLIPCFLSPLHDLDLNPGGERKKPHYHLMIMFDGVKTRDQAQDIFDKVGGVGCEIVNSPRGYARYLCHLDNPEKHLYNPEEVRSFGGADYIGVISLASDKYAALSEMTDFIRQEHISSYADMFDYCKIHKYDWFRVLCDNGSYVIKEYIKSCYWIDKNEENEEE